MLLRFDVNLHNTSEKCKNHEVEDVYDLPLPNICPDLCTNPCSSGLWLLWHKGCHPCNLTSVIWLFFPKLWLLEIPGELVVGSGMKWGKGWWDLLFAYFELVRQGPHKHCMAEGPSHGRRHQSCAAFHLSSKTLSNNCIWPAKINIKCWISISCWCHRLSYKAQLWVVNH